MAATKLTDPVRAFIVKEVACYSTPKATAELVKERYGIEISRQAVESYDPTKNTGKRLAKKWQDLFALTRAEFLKDAEAYVPLSNKSVRLRRLQEIHDAFVQKGNHVAARETIESIAKEMGNVHTNRREHTGKDGGPIKTQQIHDMTDDQLETEIHALLAEAGIKAQPKALTDESD